MKHLDLFSGIGGFALAARWMNWETVGFVEIDGFCQKVLKKNFPGVPIYGDIKQFNGKDFRGTVDVLTGGFPCQSFSLAGKGAVDLSLWKEMFRVVGEFRPKAVVAENVFGILARKKGMALSTVYNDLENEGYQTMPPLIIPACAVDAPHKRDRVWIIAYSDRNRESVSAINEGERLRKLGAVVDSVYSGSQNGRPESLECLSRESENRAIHSVNISTATESSCIPDWEIFPTQSLVHRGNDGIPNRVDRIKGLGNAVVPQVVYEIFKAIESVTITRATPGM